MATSLKQSALKRVDKLKRSYFGEHILFPETNEDVEHIVVNLSPGIEDTVLAVCGSGDQAFALLEDGARVWAVDYDKGQIAYAQHRAELLRKGRYVDFLSVGRESLILTNLEYFTAEDRLDRIRDNLDNLSFHIGNIFNPERELRKKYSRIYLSNAYEFSTDKGHRSVHRLARRLTDNGILYTATLIEEFSSCCKIRSRESIGYARMVSIMWQPEVYRSTKK